MSVLIKGMEMPKTCEECALNYDSCACIKTGSRFFRGRETEFDPFKGRLEDCPLVPVPPHGRLIDADALGQSIKESIDECHKWANEVEGGEMYARVSQSLGTFVELSLRVKAAPTIIPASDELAK